jgi:hypothetical protein
LTFVARILWLQRSPWLVEVDRRARVVIPSGGARRRVVKAIGVATSCGALVSREGVRRGASEWVRVVPCRRLKRSRNGSLAKLARP